MPNPVYDDRTARLLAASRQRADARDQLSRATATTCGWCGQPKLAGASCCNGEPWTSQDNHRTL